MRIAQNYTILKDSTENCKHLSATIVSVVMSIQN